MKKSQQSKPKIKILNIDARTKSGTLNLQAAWDVKHLYRLTKNYFEQELLQNQAELTDSKLQRTLNKRAKDVSFFEEFELDSDVRVIELAILIGILETLHRLGGLSKDYTFVPAWQKPNQKTEAQNHFGKESNDGFIVGVPKKQGDAIAIPIELKSLMTEPNKPVSTNPNGQLKSGLKKFSQYFQHEGSINCILVMPYTNEMSLSIDLKHATDDLRVSVSSKSAGFVCLLTFPYDKRGKLALSILFAILSHDPTFMTATNTNKWMCQINFGRQQP